MKSFGFTQTHWRNITLIEVKNLVKRYGSVEAVRGVSFSVKPGMIYGFLGPNGAGKSTTMNIITGCLAATEGEVTVNGCDIYEDPVGAKSAIGYLPEQPPLYMDMTPNEYLEFVGEAKGLKGDELYKAVDWAIVKTGLTAYADRIIRNLSKGYKQRVGIAQAIIGDPEIIILDEPTVGLDPRQIIEIRELIKELGRDHTVILSSHILPEISAVCDYVIIIARGQIVASDTLENLTKLYEGKNYVDMTVRGDEAKIRRAIESLPAVQSVEIEPEPLGRHHVRVATDSQTDVREELFFRFADMKAPILSMEYEEVTLEKVFLELTGDGKKKAPETAPAEDEHLSAEEAFARQAMENAKAKQEEPAPETESEPETPAEPANNDDPDDYKPLFGGN
ncbi:MAG: ATP-binding cassette domain-containing protein [Clostridia bacterium]|nr:ATP-binding cassette domain-containing protein [Clostridia bacterium]